MKNKSQQLTEWKRKSVEIDTLLERPEWVCIDILPRRMDRTVYFDLEEYLLETYLEEFSRKIQRIALKLIGYYPAYICLDDFPRRPELNTGRFRDMVGRDLGQCHMADIAAAIDFVVTNDLSTVSILLDTEPSCLLSITGYFSVTAFGFTGEAYDLLAAVVQQEGLCLRKVSESPLENPPPL